MRDFDIQYGTRNNESWCKHNVNKNSKIFINSLANQQWIWFFRKYWTEIKRSILKFTLLLLMFAFQINISYWNEWSGDIYPIFHGDYISNWYGEGVTEEYSYCYLNNTGLVDADLYSNEDLLFTYYSQIINNPVINKDIPPIINSLVKIESETGKTLWAKELMYFLNNYYFKIVKTIVINDVAWVLFAYSIIDISTPGLIARIDSTGLLIEWFYAPFYVDVASSQTFLFNVIDFYVFNDLSFITTTGWHFYQGNFGISEYSKSDFCYFYIDSNRNFIWSTSIDFLNKNEENQSMYEYNNTLYIPIVTSTFYYWLQILDKKSGKFQNSQCSYVSNPVSNTNYRQLIVSYISDKFIYAYGEGVSNTGTIYPLSLFIFNLTTLILEKVYYSEIWTNYHGFKSVDDNSDAIYWINQSRIIRVNFIEAEAIREIHYKFSENFSNETYINTFMKDISFNKFIISICQYKTFSNLNIPSVFTIKIDNNFNTDSCLGLSLVSPESKFESVKVGNNASSGEFTILKYKYDIL